MEVAQFFKDYINFEEKNFVDTTLLTILVTLMWSLLPHLEYKYKLISKLSGDSARAADFLAFFLINLGSFKNYSFIEAAIENKVFHFGKHNMIFTVTGCILVLAGIVLTMLSFKKLGLRGMYFGDHFGFVFNNKITNFPYNYMENPHYIGCKLILFGISFMFRSPAAFVLSILNVIFYQVVFRLFEKKKLKEIYSNSDKKKVS